MVLYSSVTKNQNFMNDLKKEGNNNAWKMHLVLNIFVEMKTIRASMNIYDKGSH